MKNESPEAYYDMAKRMNFKVSKQIAKVIARDSFLSYEFCLNKQFKKIPKDILLSCFSSQNNCLNYVSLVEYKDSPQEIIDLVYQVIVKQINDIKPIKISYVDLMNLSFDDELYVSQFIYNNLKDRFDFKDQVYLLSIVFKILNQLGTEPVCAKFKCVVYRFKNKYDSWLEQKDFVYCLWYAKIKLMLDKAEEEVRTRYANFCSF